VLAVCRRVLGDAHDAEDAFQATFLVLARKASTIRRQESVGSWLYGVAYRVAGKLRTEMGRRRSLERRAPLRPEVAPTADVTWRELCAVLDEELNRLPEKQRAPLHLCYLEGLTQDEAARQLGWSRGTLKRRLERGRALLRSRLTARGLSLSAGLLAVGMGHGTARAALPAALVAASVRGAVTHTVPPRVLALAEGAVHALASARLKLGAVLLSLTVAVAGAGLLSHQGLTARQAEGGPEPAAAAAEQPPARLDLGGDPLPDGAMVRLGSVRFRHSGLCLAVSPDSKVIASGSYDGRVCLWDTATGKKLRQWDGLVPWMCGLAFSADGKQLVNVVESRPGPGHVVRILEVATGRELRRFETPCFAIRSVAYPGEGRPMLAAAAPLDGKECTVRIHDLDADRELHRMEHPAPLRFLSLASDGRSVLTAAADGIVRRWDTATGKETQSWKLPDVGKGGDYASVALAPDDRTLAVGLPGCTIRLCDAGTLKEVRRLPGYDYAYSLAFTPDGHTLVAGSYEDTLHLWDVATGKEFCPLPGHRAAIGSVALSADGKLVATASQDRTLRLWDAATGKELRRIGGEDQVESLAVAPDGRTLAAACADGKVRLWQSTAVKEFRVLAGHKGAAHAVAFAPDGKTLASAGADRTVRLWDPATGKELRTILSPRGEAIGVTFSPDGRTLAVMAYEAGAGQRGFVAFAGQDQGPIANEARFWSVATGEELPQLSKGMPAARVYTAAFSPASQAIATAGFDGSIRLWDAASGRQRLGFQRDPAQSGPVDVAADTVPENVLGTASTITLTGMSRVDSLIFSPDGRTLATTWGRTVVLWEVATGRPRRQLVGHAGSVGDVVFSADGRRLVSGSSDCTALVWDLTGQSDGSRRAARDSEACWADLAGADARRADDAIRALAASPQSVTFLDKQLRPRVVIDAQRLGRLIADLDDDSFETRTAAGRELEELGRAAAPALRKGLENKPSAEARRRIEALLHQLDEPIPSGERLRGLRAVEALERTQTAEARQVLEALSRGAPEAEVTQEAKAALRRIDREPPSP
jgi:RNA polymerase sigma factor (sigma-70 family)